MDAKDFKIRLPDELKVSIHAPVMDAKDFKIRLPDELKVSIHAPVMDANTPEGVAAIMVKFQSTRP